MRRGLGLWAFLLAFAAALLAAGSGRAQELRIGLSSEPSAIDPHFHALTPNIAFASHVFEGLVLFDERSQFRPGLAESWRLVDERTWEFNLRRNVRWHDGTPFTADDVVFTYGRAGEVPRSPSSYAIYTRGRTVTKVDDHTVRITTEGPDPQMLTSAAQVLIIPAKLGQSVTTEDFNTGRAAIGTGPYRFVRFTPGSSAVMARNEEHWAGRPAWSQLTFRFLTSDPSRVAALLAGDVDVIENVPSADVGRIQNDRRLAVTATESFRLVYLGMDQNRTGPTPFVTARDGSAIPNPFRDLRVRQALNLAVNRRAIVDRIMEGQATAASQAMPDGYPGTSTRLPVVEPDIQRARRLLTEAGFPNGFRLTVHGPNGRYANDAKIIEAVAQMFSRIGIETRVEALPPAVFFSRGSQHEFSMFLSGWAAGEMTLAMRGILTTNDRARGTGTSNSGRYSNERVDALVAEAGRTVDDARRNALLAEASEVAMNDVGVIPVEFPKSVWASRREIAVTGRADERTLAMGIRPAGQAVSQEGAPPTRQ